MEKSRLLVLFVSISLITMGCNPTDVTSDGSANDVESDSFASTELQSSSLDQAVDSMTDATESLDSNVGQFSLPVVASPFDSIVEGEGFEVDEAEEITNSLDNQIAECPEPAVKQECRSDQRKSTQAQHYNRCLLKGTQTVLAGHVRLVYNNPDCSLANNGDRVRRKFNLFYKNRRTGKRVHQTSRPQRNYGGKIIGGGQSLKNTPFGWKIGIRGSNRDVKQGEQKVLNVAVHNQRAFNIFDRRERGAVYIHGGALIVDHNLAKYSTKFIPKKLKWVKGCKCPVSGSVIYKNRGSRTSSGKVEFLGCGKSLVTTRSGQTRELSRDTCLVDDQQPDVDAGSDVGVDFEEIRDDEQLEDERSDSEEIEL